MNKEEFLTKNEELVEKYVHDKEKNKVYIGMQKAMCEDFAAMQMYIDLYEALSSKYGDIMMYPCLCKRFLTHRYNWFMFYIRSLKMNIDFSVGKDTKDLMFQLWRTRNILLLDFNEWKNIKDNKERIDFVIKEIEDKIERNKIIKKSKKVADSPKVVTKPTKRKRIRIAKQIKY